MVYRKGDIVVLRSGGPAMTVVSSQNKELTCIYFSPFREIMRSWIGPVEAVVPQDQLRDSEER
jgi:uncharacterized protein YodC (DUF2158 family)